MITAAEYWTLVRQQEASLSGEALLNAARSALKLSPFTPEVDRNSDLVSYVTTLPYFSIGADGTPALVLPPPVTPAPAPPPGTVTTETPPQSSGAGFTTTGGSSGASPPGECPPGYVPASSLLGQGGAGAPVPLSTQIGGLLSGLPTNGGAPNGSVCGLRPSLSAGCPVTKNDFIRITGYNANGTQIQILITVRMVLCDGTISTASYQLNVPARTLGLAPVNLICIPLTDGFLCSVVANGGGTPCAPGMIWVQAILTTGSCNAGSTAITQPTPMLLFQDALTLSGFASWPNGRVIQPTDLAGGPFSQNWPVQTWTDQFWNPDSNTMARVEWVSVILRTSAVVANRGLELQFQPGQGANGYFGSSTTQPANTTYRWMWSPYVSPGFLSTTNTVNIPIPADTLLTDVDQLGIIGSNIDANDSIVRGGGVHYLTFAGASV